MKIQSNLYNALYEEIQKMSKKNVVKKKHKLVQDCVTRWNSAYDITNSHNIKFKLQILFLKINKLINGL